MLAGVVSGFIGVFQLIAIALVEAANSDGPGGHDIADDTVHAVFALFLTAEIVSVIISAIYRFSPWILRLLKAHWEARETLEQRRQSRRLILGATFFSTLGRRLIVMFDTGTFETPLVGTFLIALIAFAIPPPKRSLKR